MRRARRWRSGAGVLRAQVHELVVWDIATRALRVLATSALTPAMSPLWSLDGSEIVTLHTTTALSYAPGLPFEGKAEVSLASVLTGQYRTLAIDRPLIPLFADGNVVTGLSFSGDKKYAVIDARSGQTVRELTQSAALAVLPTANRDVVIVVRETGTDWVVTLHAVNAQTGAELGQLGKTYAGPLPSWPGRSEIVFVADDELRAFDYVANTTRAVGNLEGGTGPLAFDALGTVLLAARQVEPRYGTFSVKDGRLTSAFRVIPLRSSSFGRALGLVQIRP